MTTILSLDPGKVTGYAQGYFHGDEPLEFYREGVRIDPKGVQILLLADDSEITVAERFVLSSGNRYTADLSGVRIEGLIEAYRPHAVWRSRADKAQVPDQILKDHGLWVTGKDVGWEDGRDVNDAIIHALGHVAFTLNHRPTLERYFR